MDPRTLLLLTLLAAAASSLAAVSDTLLWNRIGYEATGPKTAVVKNAQGAVATTSFEVLDAGGKTVFTGTPSAQATVPGWGASAWKVLDFSALPDTGSFQIRLLPSGRTSGFFDVGSALLLRKAGPSVVSFFRNMRSTDAGDRSIGYFGQPARGKRDVYGGWKDATGDDGKYLSHLSYANVMNPQQIPMVVWSLLRTRLLAPEATASWKVDLTAEGAWGADYLLRVQDAAGYFYINVYRKDWSPANPKLICAWTGDATGTSTQTSDYQAAWREGGGMSIAALALAARMGVSGDSSSAQYLAGAVRGFEHLSAAKGRWADNAKENLLDHYCALMAAVELAQATKESRYLEFAAERVDSIAARQTSEGWFIADDGTRPFYHAADEGLPLVALWAYLEADSTSAHADKARATLARSLANYRAITREVANPFGYPRMNTPAAAVSGGGAAINLALGAVPSASASQAGYPVVQALDGSTTTRWSSWDSLGTTTTNAKGWISLDLGSVKAIDSVNLMWEAAYASKYLLLTSVDGVKWDTAYTRSLLSYGWDRHAVGGISARYVKMQGVTLATPYGYSLYEFQVLQIPRDTATTALPSVKRFFMPHSNETKYWWQGENARLGSMATAFLLAGRAVDPKWSLGGDSLSKEAVAPLDWILGKNPVNVNFLFGVAGGNYAGYNGNANVVGGIANGITSDAATEQAPYFGNSDASWTYWRWVEQWLPHDAWFLLGTAALARAQALPPPVVGVAPRAAAASASPRLVRNGNRLQCSFPGAVEFRVLTPEGRVLARAVGASVGFDLETLPHGILLVQALDGGGAHGVRFVRP